MGVGGGGGNSIMAKLKVQIGSGQESEGSHAHFGSWTAQETHHVDSGCFEIVSSHWKHASGFA